MMRKIFLFLLLFGQVAQAQVTWKASLDSNAIRLGEQVTLTLTAEVPEMADPIWPEVGDTLGGMEVVSKGKIDTLKGDVVTLVQDIRLTRFDTGFAIVAPLTLKVGDQTFDTDPQLIRINDVPVDDDQELYDIKEPIPAPFNYLKWALILLGSVLIIILGYWIYKRITQKEDVKEVSFHERVDPWVTLLKRLRDMQRQQTWEGEIKTHYSDLSEILRRYIEVVFNVDALEIPTSEIRREARILPWLKDDRESLIGLLERADLVKFAKSDPGPDSARDDLLIAIQLIERTHPRKEPEHE